MWSSTRTSTRAHGCFKGCGNLVRACQLPFNAIISWTLIWRGLNNSLLLQEPTDDPSRKSVRVKLTGRGISCAAVIFCNRDKWFRGNEESSMIVFHDVGLYAVLFVHRRCFITSVSETFWTLNVCTFMEFFSTKDACLRLSFSSYLWSE